MFVGRDAWKKKYFDEKRKTVPLEEEAKKLRNELDTAYKKIVAHMEKAHDGHQCTAGQQVTGVEISGWGRPHCKLCDILPFIFIAACTVSLVLGCTAPLNRSPFYCVLEIVTLLLLLLFQYFVEI